MCPRQNNGPQKLSMSQSLESVTTRPGKGNLQIKVENFEVRRLAWITQVNLTSSRASLKMENFQAVIKERDVTTEVREMLVLQMDEGGHEPRNVGSF